MSKLLTVSVMFHNRRMTVFVQGTVGPDGKVRVDQSVVDKMLRELECVHRGQTYSIA